MVVLTLLNPHTTPKVFAFLAPPLHKSLTGFAWSGLSVAVSIWSVRQFGATSERMEGKQRGVECLDWFMCLRKLPREQLALPPRWKRK